MNRICEQKKKRIEKGRKRGDTGERKNEGGEEEKEKGEGEKKKREVIRGTLDKRARKRTTTQATVDCPFRKV